MKINFLQVNLFMKTYEELQNQNLPISLAFKLNKIINLLGNDYDFLNHKLSETLIEYCDKDENNNPIINENENLHFSKENISICNEKIKEIEDMEFEIQDIKISLKEFEGINIKLSLIEGLMPFIEE